MNHKIKNGLFILAFSVIVVGLFVMTNSIDNIFAIKDEGGKNTDKKSTTNSSPNNNNNNNKEGCSPLDPRC
ncbi:MAG TPA: hypothetical protein VIZ62_09060 [Nitrososphaeraceae archaeon]